MEAHFFKVDSNIMGIDVSTIVSNSFQRTEYAC